MQVELGFKGEFPEKHTCDGKDISPEIKFKDIPSSAETLALVIDDPDAPGQVFDHWVIWNITSKKLGTGIPQQETFKGMKQGKNDFGELGYRGPCPPGEKHTYRIKTYALESKPGLEPGISKKKLENNIKESIVDSETLERDYTR